MIYSGLTGTEILFGLVITEFMVMVGQTVMVNIVAFVIFKITCLGDIGWITLLIILTGLCGMSFGNLFIILILYFVDCIIYYLLFHQKWSQFLFSNYNFQDLSSPVHVTMIEALRTWRWVRFFLSLCYAGLFGP